MRNAGIPLMRNFKNMSYKSEISEISEYFVNIYRCSAK